MALALTTGAARAQVVEGMAETGLGAYLAARASAQAADFAAAADWLPRALEGDPGNLRLLEGALTAYMGLGEIDEAAAIADRIEAAGRPSELANLARSAVAARDGDWDALVAGLDAGRSLGPLPDGLLRGWALLGRGEEEAALAAFDAVAETPGLRAFGLYHKALALASTNELAAAEAVLAGVAGTDQPPARRAVLARAEALGALGRAADGVAAIDAAPPAALDPALAALRGRLAAGEPVAVSVATTPTEGVAEAYFTVAEALGQDGGEAALMYARAALAIDPGHAAAALKTAGLLVALGRDDLAGRAYALVPPGDAAFPAAEIGRALTLRRLGDGEAAVAVLEDLAAARPDLPEVHATLGDQLRMLSRLPEADAAYGRAIDLYAEDDSPLWFVHYGRAIVRHALDDWAGAEADLRQALALEPGNPGVLNYLGYSLIERGEALDEALALIEQAVAADPESGAILDSLGWAHFRLGRHDEAVGELERAATLEPTDAVVNDHLGDAYWTVGRHREARFQWSRALSFDPEPEAAEAIRRKLRDGLGAPPDLTADSPAETDG